MSGLSRPMKERPVGPRRSPGYNKTTGTFRVLPSIWRRSADVRKKGYSAPARPISARERSSLSECRSANSQINRLQSAAMPSGPSIRGSSFDFKYWRPRSGSFSATRSSQYNTLSIQPCPWARNLSKKSSEGRATARSNHLQSNPHSTFALPFANGTHPRGRTERLQTYSFALC